MATSTPERPIVEITIPAEYVDEFRCALMDEMAHNGGWFRSNHDEMIDRGDGDRTDRDPALAWISGGLDRPVLIVDSA